VLVTTAGSFILQGHGVPPSLLTHDGILQYTLVIMDEVIRDQLLQINQTFYDQFAGSFSATRGRVQPGVRRVLGQVAPDSAILDVGCGNGTLALALEKGGFGGQYLGVDLSAGLISEAEERIGQISAVQYDFKQMDLAVAGWQEALAGKTFDWVVCFAVLHHLPGKALQQQVAQTFAALVSSSGRVAVSAWQWQNSPRLCKRVLPWSAVGIDPALLDAGDVLLDWRAGEQVGLRYVHTFSEASLAELAEKVGFKVIETFYSDGKPGNLALYQVWGLT